MLTSDTPLETSSAANTEQMGHMENTSGLDAAGIITTVQATLQAGVGEPSGRILGKSILLTDEIPRYEVGPHEAALLKAVSPIRNQHTAGEEMSRNISLSNLHTAADEKKARDLSLSDPSTATFRVASHEHTLGKTKGEFKCYQAVTCICKIVCLRTKRSEFLFPWGSRYRQRLV